MFPRRISFVIAPVVLLLLGCKSTPAESTATGSASAGDGAQHIAVRADDQGFTPSSVTLKKGQPAVLVFTRTTDQTCAKQVVFSDLGLKKELPLNQPVEIDVPTGDARTLSFVCGMNMFKGSVVVK